MESDTNNRLVEPSLFLGSPEVSVPRLLGEGLAGKLYNFTQRFQCTNNAIF